MKRALNHYFYLHFVFTVKILKSMSKILWCYFPAFYFVYIGAL